MCRSSARMGERSILCSLRGRCAAAWRSASSSERRALSSDFYRLRKSPNPFFHSFGRLCQVIPVVPDFLPLVQSAEYSGTNQDGQRYGSADIVVVWKVVLVVVPFYVARCY